MRERVGKRVRVRCGAAQHEGEGEGGIVGPKYAHYPSTHLLLRFKCSRCFKLCSAFKAASNLPSSKWLSLVPGEFTQQHVHYPRHLPLRSKGDRCGVRARGVRRIICCDERGVHRMRG